jgi:hypothetical protein
MSPGGEIAIPMSANKYLSLFQVKIGANANVYRDGFSHYDACCIRNGVSSRLTPEKSSRTKIAFRNAASSR